jgi:hypothetical protein
MTWLKTFGLEVLKVIGVVSGLLGGQGAAAITSAYPSASGVVTSVESDLTLVANVITMIETAFAGASASGTVTLPPQTGPIKLAAAAPLVQQVIANSGLMKGQRVKNQALYTSAVKTITSGMADLLNSLDPQTIKTEKL